MPRPRAALLTKTCVRTECGATFTTPDKVHFRDKRYCTRTCANRDTTEARDQVRGVGALGYTPPICPCGAEVQPSPGQKYVYGDNKKYCSDECRGKYGKKRQPDPANYITLTCQNLSCNREFTQRKNYSRYGKFCSRECAYRHTRTRQNVVLRDSDVVLDSSWEALFWGLCGFLKTPCARVDRALVVGGDGFSAYAPDFWLSGLEIYIEVKGQQGPEDVAKWTAWREQRGPLVVVDREVLDELRRAFDDVLFLAVLSEQAYAQNGVMPAPVEKS